MRKFLGLAMTAVATAALTGCECCDAFMRFETWKNNALFGCLSHNACAPACAPTQAYAPVAVDPCATQYGPQLASPYGDCYGSAPVISGPACQDGCGTVIPGQTIIPGQAVVVPGTTLAPTPVPTLMP